MWTGKNLRGDLGPSTSEDGDVLELFSACSEPPVWADKGAFPLEDGAWQGCSHSLARVHHLTHCVLHHFCAGALAWEPVDAVQNAVCCVVGGIATRVQCLLTCLWPSVFWGCPQPSGTLCLAAPPPAQVLTPGDSEQFLGGFLTPEGYLVALWCSCCAGGSPAPATPLSWLETRAQLPRNLTELKLRHRELVLLSMGPCSACLGKEH